MMLDPYQQTKNMLVSYGPRNWGSSDHRRPRLTCTKRKGHRVDKASATPAALHLLAAIIADHGPVMCYQSRGCCDGSSPMCYAQGDFLVGNPDIQPGQIGGMPFYISGAQMICGNTLT